MIGSRSDLTIHYDRQAAECDVSAMQKKRASNYVLIAELLLIGAFSFAFYQLQYYWQYLNS
jgi:hypothetical protein